MLYIEAPFAQTGYGYCSYYLVKELSKITNVVISPIKNRIDDEFKDIAHLKTESTPRQDDTVLKIWHEYGLEPRPKCKKYIALTFFEIDDLDDRRIKSLQCPDLVITASHWAKNIIEKYGIKCDVVPMGVDTNIFMPKKDKNNNIFKLLNCGKWEIRKGHDILPEIIKRSGVKVQLNMMVNNIFLNQEEIDDWENYYIRELDNTEIVFHSPNNHQQVAEIIAKCDAAIFPSRAEGWNMEALESMACGLPVIITNYSAHTEFCNSKNSKLIDIDNLEPAYDGRWFDGTFNWAAINEKQIDQAASYIYDLVMSWSKDKKSIINYNGIDTANELKWEKIARLLLDKLA